MDKKRKKLSQTQLDEALKFLLTQPEQSPEVTQESVLRDLFRNRNQAQTQESGSTIQRLLEKLMEMKNSFGPPAPSPTGPSPYPKPPFNTAPMPNINPQQNPQIQQILAQLQQQKMG